MSKATTTEVHERKHRRPIDRRELERIVGDAVLAELGIRCAPWVKVTIRFEDQTEGSPAYRVGTRAVVDVIEDLMPQVAEAP